MREGPMRDGKYKILKMIVFLEDDEELLYVFDDTDTAYYRRSTNYQTKGDKILSSWKEHTARWITERIENA